MPESDQQYDVAISFLHRDEPIAEEIHNRLADQLNIFVYSKKQEELAGTDGLESFRSFLAEGWDFLLFVSLADADPPPKWLPKTEIRFSFQQYPLEQLLGAIKRRAQKLGGKVREETPVDLAKRVERERQSRYERERRLVNEGFAAVHAEYQSVADAVRQQVQEMNQHLSAPIEVGGDQRSLTLRSSRVSINAFLDPAQPVSDSRIVVQEWRGRLRFPSEGMYPVEPQRLAKKDYHFDCQAAYGWCWRDAALKSYLNSAQLAECIVKNLLRLHERLEKERKDR